MNKIIGKVVVKRPIANGIEEIIVAKPDNSKIFDFAPGQYATLAFDDSKKVVRERPFSIASSPSHPERLSFGIKTFGEYTQGLGQIEVGDKVYIGGPYGDFVFNPVKHSDAVFIAGGIGITPFVSMISYVTEHKLPNKITLFYSVRTRGDAVYLTELQQYAKQNPNIKLIVTCTDDPEAQKEHFLCERISAKTLQTYLPSLIETKEYFVCGPPAFAKAIIDSLKQIGVKKTRIHREEFALAPSSFFQLDSPFAQVIYAGILIFMLASFGIVYAVDQTKQQTTNTQIVQEQTAPQQTLNYSYSTSTPSSNQSATTSTTAPLVSTNNQTTAPTTNQYQNIQPRTRVS